jgi:acyl-CoA hydrolase
MEFTTGDIIQIVIAVFVIVGLYVKMRVDMVSFRKDSEILYQKTESSLNMVKKDIENLTHSAIEKDKKIEKVLEKLEIALEKLNDNQVELSKAIIELKVEIGSKKD